MDLFSTFVDCMSTNLDGDNPQMLYVPRMNLGGRIAKRLSELGWSQVDLLDRVPEMNAGTLSATILRDAKKSQFAGKIAKALDVRLEWLQYGEGPMRDSATAPRQPDPSQIGTPKRTMIDIMDELSEQIAKADPSVRDEIARLVMSYIDKPEGKSRIAQAIKALLSDHADPGI